MLKLNLIDQDNSDIKYKINYFPDGEVMFEFISELDRKEEIGIITRIRNANELFILLQIGDILNRHGIIFDLKILYLMSSRIDRVIDFNKPYNLKIVSDLLKYIEPRSINIIEPHSNKFSELLINIVYENKGIAESIIKSLIKDTSKDIILLFPDKGAKDRYNYLFPLINRIYCNKKRDSEGKLISFELNDYSIDLKGKDIYVVDDLCDGGGTFLGIRHILVGKDIKSINLIVTHAVQFKGIIKVSEVYNDVFISNSYEDWNNVSQDLPKNVKVIEIKV